MPSIPLQAVVNVRQFQAAGDGRADDTSAVRAAIAAAPAGSVVYFPKGTYLVTPTKKGSLFNLKKSLVFLGDGFHSCIKVKADSGDYRALFRTSAPLEHLTFRDLRFDQNTSHQTNANVKAAGSVDEHFVIEVESDDLVVEDCWFWPYHGVNALVTVNYGRRRARIENNNFKFERAASTGNKWYDNSAIYSRAPQSIVRGNRFIADAVADTYALGAIEIHAADAIVTNNYTKNFATLCNWAPTSGSGGDMAAIISQNEAVNCSRGIQLWVNDDSTGLQVTDNLLLVRQTLWKRAICSGISSGSGAKSLTAFRIAGNIVDLEPETTRRTIIDPISGIVEQQYACVGIGLNANGATYVDGIVDGNLVINCPFIGYGFGANNGSSTLTRVTTRNNVSVNNGHYAWADSDRYRAHFSWSGTLTECLDSDNVLRETHSPLLSRYRHRANDGKATRCVAENNRFLTTASDQSLSADSYGSGWTVRRTLGELEAEVNELKALLRSDKGLP